MLIAQTSDLARTESQARRANERLFFNVSNLKEIGRAYRMVAAMAAIDRQRAEQHRLNLVRLRTAHETIEERRAEMIKLQRAASAARSAADRAAQARAEPINDNQ